MGGQKQYKYPSGEGIVVKSGFTPSRNDFVELELGTGSAMQPVDFSDKIAGLVGVPTTGLLQQPNETTIEPMASYRQNKVAGEIIKGGAPVMLKPSDGKVYTFLPVFADAGGTITFTTTATGGTHTITIGGFSILLVVTTETVNAAATAMAVALNADSGFKALGLFASATTNVVTVSGKRGALDNAITLTESTTDAAQSMAVSAATLTGGFGYPDGSKFGIAMSNAASAATLDVLVFGRGV